MDNIDKQELFERFENLIESYNDFESLLRRKLNKGEYARARATFLVNIETNLGEGRAMPHSNNAKSQLMAIGIDVDEARADDYYFEREEEEEEEEEEE